MGGLFTILMDFIKNVLDWFGIILYNLAIDFGNALILALSIIFQGLIAFLPSTSLPTDPPAELINLAAHVNWFIPMGTMSTCLAVLALCYVAFFTIRPILKFIHLA